MLRSPAGEGGFARALPVVRFHRSWSSCRPYRTAQEERWEWVGKDRLRRREETVVRALFLLQCYWSRVGCSLSKKSIVKLPSKVRYPSLRRILTGDFSPARMVVKIHVKEHYSLRGIVPRVLGWSGKENAHFLNFDIRGNGDSSSTRIH
ncbi:hypothetical protein QJS04_geneDACA024871 [Acorus gramineus]|uniref:Uncharacterized protein n=1 Tax=Acorus gramineus TaxID=55184 RepID=A0AAV9ARQ3_ACOGR|nr:hypothetical protein QJS04_geneDACA024871 [Acorus gramineus]